MLSVRVSSVLRKRCELRLPMAPVLFLAFWCVSAKSVAHEIGLLDHRTPSYVQFSSPIYTIAAAETNILITVLRTGEFRESCSVHFQTAENTARAGTDYAATDGTLLFPAGQSLQTFSVSIHAAPDVAEQKSLRLELSTTNPNVILTGSNATVTIVASNPASAQPRLNVTRGAGSQIAVSWASTLETFVLERSRSALPDTWQQVSAIPIPEQNIWTLTDSCTEPTCFYRLRKKAGE